MNYLQKYKNIICGLLINAMESFDFVLYGYYATLIAPVFFPDEDPKLEQLKALLVFAAMFVMKPLGGLIFGHIGDRYGRRTSLIISVMVITIPTFLIGLLPGYDVLGILAPIFLVIFLSIQGLGAAAANSSAAVFLNEHAKPHTKSLFSGFLFSSAFFGAAFASLLGIFFVKHYPLWGWRIVFLIGSILGLGILVLRKNLEETPSFKKQSHSVSTKKATPLRDILSRRKKNLLCTMGIAAGANLPFFVILIYINTILSADLFVPNPDILRHNVYVLLFWTILLPLFGALGDRIGEKKLMLIGSGLLVLVPVPLMQWFLAEKTVPVLLASRFLLSLASMSIVAPCAAYLARLFPVEERQTGLGFGYFMGAALFGGTAPSVCLYFSTLFASPLFPGFYLSLFGVLTFVCLKSSRIVSN